MANNGSENLRGHIELVYPSKYVKSADLKGRDVTVIIENIAKETLVMVGGKRDRKAVVTMRARQKDGTPGAVLGKQWVVGKTVLRQIGDALNKTKEMGNWIGREVTMFPSTCQGQSGKMVECIRVRVRVNQAANDVPDAMAEEPLPQAPEFDPGDEQ